MSNLKDLCSVLITCYQRELYIQETVASVFNQTYRPIECIVINDGSTDNSLKVIERLSKQYGSDEDFKFIYTSTDNNGACSARNLAFSLSKGVYVQNLDSDDLLHPDKLSLQIKALTEHKECSAAWNPLFRFNDGEEDVVKTKVNREFSIRPLTSNAFLPQFLPAAALHRRSVLERAGDWTENLKRWQDLEYQVRLTSIMNYYIEFSSPLYFFRQHDNGRINDLFKQKQGVAYGIEALLSLEYYLTNKQKDDANVNKTVREMYLSLFNTAILNELNIESQQTLNYALNWSTSSRVNLKIKTLLLALKVLKPKTVKSLLLKTKYLSNAS